MARKLTREELKDEVFTPVRSPDEVGKAERARDIWSEFKWLFIFCFALLLALAWLVFSVVSQIPDMTLCVVSSEKVLTQDELDRLSGELMRYGVNVNLDGKSVVKVVAGYYDADGSKADDPGYADAIAAFQNYLDGKEYMTFCDETTAQYIRSLGLDRTMKEYSSKFPDDMIGMKADDTFCFSSDEELYTLYPGWRMVMRSYEGNPQKNNRLLAAYLYMESLVADIKTENFDYLTTTSEAAN